MSAGSTSLVPTLPGERTLLTAYLAPQQAPLETQPGCSEVPTSTGTATNSDLQQDSVHSALRQQQAQARVQQAEQAQQSSGHPHLRLLQQESEHSALLRQQQAQMQTQAEPAQQAQQAPTQRLLRPRPQQAWDLVNYDSEDSDLDYAPPKPSGTRRVRRTRAKNRQKEKQAAVCDELEDLRDQIKALQGMNVQQLEEIELLQQRLLLATSALLPPELA